MAWLLINCFLLLCWIPTHLSESTECPHNCACTGQTIICRNAGYKSIPPLPNSIPNSDGGALQFLLFIQNPIIRLEKASFDRQTDLTRLDLSSNQLVWISVEAFVGLPALKSLSLRENRLAYLPQDLFTPIVLIEDLDLSRNQLKSLPFSLEGLIYLKRLNLFGNPLHCPCELVDFAIHLSFIESKRTPVLCHTPPEVRGQSLSQMGKRLHTVLNSTLLWGYSNSDSSNVGYQARSYPYQIEPEMMSIRWPWPHCPRQDFGGHVPRLYMKSNEDAATNDPELNQTTAIPDKEISSEDRSPIIVTTLQSVQVVLGEVARFICRVNGSQNAQIHWIIPENATRFIRLYRRRQILEITEVHEYHVGTYTCIATNRISSVTSQATLGLIQPLKPSIIDAPPADDNIVEEQSTLDLRCTAHGRPRPQVSWLWRKEILPIHLVTGGKYTVRPLDSDTVSLAYTYDDNDLSIYNTDDYLLKYQTNSEATSMLIIRNVTNEDAHGRYICYVSNRVGSARVSTVIQVVPSEVKPMRHTSPEIGKDELKVEKSNGTDLGSLDGDELVRQVIEKARKRIEAAIKKTADRLRDTGRRRSSADVASLFRQPNQAALELAKAAEVYEAAIDEVISILRQRNYKRVDVNGTEDALDEFTDDERDPNSRKALGVELSSEQLAIIAQLSGCQESVQIDPCSKQICFHLRYRSIDGTCNNFNHPRWGAALAPFKRLLPPQYENGINTPIGWSSTKLYFGYPKPSARLVSRELLGNATLMGILETRLSTLNKKIMAGAQTGINDGSNYVNQFPRNQVNMVTFENQTNQMNKLFDEDLHFSGMLMQWGQFLDHDLDFTPVDASTSRFSDGLGCNETCVNDPPCFPILVPPGDPRIKHRCIGFARSSATCGSGSTSILLGKPRHREQLNQITAFIDASNVYGSDDFENSQLRETLFDEGKMREGMPTEMGKRLLPFNIRGQVDCQADPQQDFVPCFKAGDHRSNENLGLLSMHTLWVREHNRLADDLRTLNPHWSGDRLFHEARKIVGAQMQAITYESWLPLILGHNYTNLMGPYTGYDDQINPTISNAFATSAMRFGHTLVPPIVFRLNEDYEPIKQGHLLLHQAFFAPDRLLKDGGMDPIIRGLLYNGVRDRARNPPLNSELTERLFAMAHELALDLAALNVQRGRDHGLPSYTEYAHKFCNFGTSPHPESFDDLKSRITKPHLLEGLRRVYGHPGNIDLFTGGILEDLLPGARVGPTFACIIADQFRRLRSGDRLWYEAPGVFSPAQVAEIKRSGSSLARVICDNADNITRVPKFDFIRPRSKDHLISCEQVPKFNLAAWKECPSTSGFYYSYHGSASYITDTGRLEVAETKRRVKRDLPQEQASPSEKSYMPCAEFALPQSQQLRQLIDRIQVLENKLKLLMN